ncbi:uncharacterized protein V1510DRAFT_361214 [Dipodascopsis tothii]|uniref:uncharacterized protein n=1 Tax=Dipodascopsis tothii TaxID=44089 RepID=UPI0034CFD5A0
MCLIVKAATPRAAIGRQSPRRLSWVHNLSAKIAASNSARGTIETTDDTGSAGCAPVEKSIEKRAQSPTKSLQHLSRSVSTPNFAVSAPDLDSAMDRTSALDKRSAGSKSGFFSSLRKLSIKSGHSVGPREYERVVMNKNTSRPECPVHELKDVNLKRVGFRVDLIEDKVLAKEPLYIQIRKAVARQAERDRINTAKLCTMIDSTIDKHYVSLEPLANRVKYQGIDPEIARLIHRRSNDSLRSANVLTEDTPPQLRHDSMSTIDTTSSLETRSTSSVDERAAAARAPEATGVPAAPAAPPDGPATLSEAEVEERTNLEKIYMRCCKLRELVPLAYIRNQLQGKRERLEYLKVVLSNIGNAQQTLCAAQAIADFITVTPIDRICFDSCDIRDNVMKTFMASIMTSSVRSISFRNVRLEPSGWKVLCYFLTMNRCIERVDLSGLTRMPAEWTLLSRALDARTKPLEVILDQCNIGSADLARVRSCSSSTRSVAPSL